MVGFGQSGCQSAVLQLERRATRYISCIFNGSPITIPSLENDPMRTGPRLRLAVAASWLFVSNGAAVALSAEAEIPATVAPDAEGIPPGAAPVADADPDAATQEMPETAYRAEGFQRPDPPDEATFPDLRPLSPEHDVWIDMERKRVVMRGGVCLRRGPIEMFACIHQWVPDRFSPNSKVKRGTKEYESVVTINTTAALVHTALLAVGAEVGRPVQFVPEYRPAEGTEIEVLVCWEDEDGNQQQARAQDWVRNERTGKAMEHRWVFAGSGFFVEPRTGRRHYMGEVGNLICVANFVDAVLDVPIESSASNEHLLYEAYTENIPPVGTPVTIVLIPKTCENS